VQDTTKAQIHFNNKEVRLMPIYEYKCRECGNEFEELTFAKTSDPVPCPSCKSEKTERKISLVSGRSFSSGSCGTSGFS
jgi:putative FmdB family regulatory protein